MNLKKPRFLQSTKPKTIKIQHFPYIHTTTKDPYKDFTLTKLWKISKSLHKNSKTLLHQIYNTEHTHTKNASYLPYLCYFQKRIKSPTPETAKPNTSQVIFFPPYFPLNKAKEKPTHNLKNKEQRNQCQLSMQLPSFFLEPPLFF